MLQLFVRMFLMMVLDTTANDNGVVFVSTTCIIFSWQGCVVNVVDDTDTGVSGVCS